MYVFHTETGDSDISAAEDIVNEFVKSGIPRKRVGWTHNRDHGVSILESIEKYLPLCEKAIFVVSDVFLQEQYFLLNYAHRVLTYRRKYAFSANVIMPDVNESKLLEVSHRQYTKYVEPNTSHTARRDRFVNELIAFRKNKQKLECLIEPGEVGYVFAWTFYYGYLKISLAAKYKEAVKMIQNWGYQTRMSPRLLLVFPESCRCDKSFVQVDSSSFSDTGKRLTCEVTVAGTEKRNYSSSVYEVKAADGEKFYMAGEFITPIMAMYEMAEAKLVDFTMEQKDKQKEVFLQQLEAIFSHELNNDLKNMYTIVRYPDMGDKPLRDIVVDRIKSFLDTDPPLDKLAVN